MKFLFQILLLFLTWFTNFANATPAFTKPTLPIYELTFSKTENVKEASIVKIVDCIILATGSSGTISISDYYSFSVADRIMDPIVYVLIDVFGMIPVVDYFADGVGVLYSGIRGNSENVLIYSAALATPFAGAAIYKGVKKLVSLYVKKNSSNIYELAIKEAFEEHAGWYKCSNDVALDESAVNSAKQQLNNSSKITGITQSKRKDLYDVAVSGAGNDLLALLTKQKQRLQNLKTQHGNLDFIDFAPTGGKTTNDITSTMYNEMFADLGSRSSWTTQRKVDKIIQVLASGKTVPQKVTYQQGTELFKVVKKDITPDDFTEYWVTKTELDDLISKGSNLESKSGLPLGSMADEYDIYKITANQPAPTYRSIIAPTTQRGYTTTGGATQTLVLDRSFWSAPTKYNTQSYIPDF